MPEVVAGPEDDGRRLDVALADASGLSRSRVQRLLAEGQATRNGEVGAPRDRVVSGDRLGWVDVAPDTRLVADAAVPLEVVYEDDDVIVVNKAAGVVVHPGTGSREGTLAAGVLSRFPEIASVGPPERPGIVHRLDRDTSGLLVVARRPAALKSLAMQFRRHTATRTYVALVRGAMEMPRGTVDAALGRDPRDPRRVALRTTGRPARTHYRVLALWDRPVASLLAVRLETGRTHQIRVHLAGIGHPIVGDRKYGSRDPEPLRAPRPFLHAAVLSFTHPDGTLHSFVAPLPDDLRDVVDVLDPPPDVVEVLAGLHPARPVDAHPSGLAVESPPESRERRARPRAVESGAE